ncbi:FAD:protein FMN transferase [Microbacterium sp. zg.Y1090]|uniref:FAD:protein FMN transferase n=1 Tax=Microbacterium TaxID=33882 RepID=UPI00214BCAAC|nr:MULTISPECIES: FAD:protein FMN transferase [unclassified Microbacterium]MCR2812206.1 FAD:protein FMN transferase [Microbacterium sp. zg.Y1084]MCR2818356.1 FAD:protein FMN transferase [Microbacterium sp. zg.Y1090]MDL5486168.1 FAD:protein FMN transferase [Microbacterium sp. zg-Y1211]WIM29375.1 FAD:protein FMN transferase [Microbacterium sp. zg-Y1090]
MTGAPVSWRFEAIGTRWEIVTEAALPPAARALVAETVDRFDRAWSRFRSDSLVSRLAAGGSVPPPDDAGDMLGVFAELTGATGGAVSPLVGDALAARGYDADYSLVDRGALPSREDWRTRLRWDAERLQLDGPATIDVGALGKGRLVDLVGACLAPWTGDGALVVDAGGDVLVRGTTERIGLEHPYDPTRAIGVWEMTDAALCASAVTRRAWGEGLHHVLDARTGEPVRAVAATWAVAATAMRADAAATALFFAGGAELAARWGVSWVRMRTDGTVDWSPGCTAEVFRSAR